MRTGTAMEMGMNMNRQKPEPGAVFWITIGLSLEI